MSEKYVARAFLSCSLRPEDIPFVEYVSRILKSHGIKPDGTVGRHFAAPENPAESMINQIDEYDFLVLAATPRYFSTDVHTEKDFKLFSEQLYTEIGIAKGLNKPIIAFVQAGTNPGNFLSQITQYIILDGTKKDYLTKSHLIYNLINNTYNKVRELKGDNDFKVLKSTVVGGLAIYGTFKLLQFLLSDE